MCFMANGSITTEGFLEFHTQTLIYILKWDSNYFLNETSISNLQNEDVVIFYCSYDL